MRKIKNNLPGFIASIVTIITPIIAGLVLWNKLPDRVALHFSFDGTPDQYYSKGFAVFGMYLILLALHLFTTILTALEDSKRQGIPDNIYGLIIWIVPLVSLLVAVLAYGNALGFGIDVTLISLLFLGFIYLVLGNYLPKVRQNGVFGTRIKWTMESRKNWEHTNRFSAFTLIVMGLLYILTAFAKNLNQLTEKLLPILCIIFVMVDVIIIVIYSYSYYLKHKDDADYYE
ncbi:MAG: SdpI family protein [Lachnospiraceae bacterium]|nr:SdpI family protein [Lachnospiraceae bacterium]